MKDVKNTLKWINQCVRLKLPDTALILVQSYSSDQRERPEAAARKAGKRKASGSAAFNRYAKRQQRALHEANGCD